MNPENYDRDINQYINQIKSAHTADDKQVRVDRLIVLLAKIEKELTTIETTLDKLTNHIKKNPNSYKANTINTIVSKKATVVRLKDKIAKTRLNLNYFFM